MNVREAIKNIPLFRAARSSTLEELISYAMLKHYKKGEHLFFDQDDVRQVYFLADGTVSLYKLNQSHMKKVIFIYGAGAMLNEVILDDKPTSVNCEFLSDARVVSFDARKFLSFCEQDFGLTKAVMDSMALKIRRLYHQMKNTVNTLRGDKRIAAKLWKLSLDHGVPCKYGIKIGFELTITFLADLLGSKRETVSRQLKMLTDQNLVIVNKKRFIIPDRDKLLEYFNQS